jgi:hypothetical protein
VFVRSPPVDIEARAASWTLEGTLVSVANGVVVGSLHFEQSRFGFGAGARTHALSVESC